MSAVLSNKEVIRLYGKDIFIYPFSTDNLDGGTTYNLTASRFAFYIDYNADHKKCFIYAVNCDDYIVLPSNKTVLIQTNECIFVSSKVCGTYHSKVGLVCKGLSHISTTLDPEYFGTSLIAIHNNSGADQFIRVGDTFVSLMLYKLSKPAVSRHDNVAGRYDLLSGEIVDLSFSKCTNTEAIDELRKKLVEWRNEKYRLSKNVLIEKCHEMRDSLLLPKRRKALSYISNSISIIFALVPSITIVVYFLLRRQIPFISEILNNESAAAIIIAVCSSIMFLKDRIVNLFRLHFINKDNLN